MLSRCFILLAKITFGNTTRTKQTDCEGSCRRRAAAAASAANAISGKSFILEVMNPPQGVCDLCSLFRAL